jgi:hypothetical protein
MKTTRSAALVAAGMLVGTVLTAGGFAYANIPDSSGVIHGCYAKNGALSVVNAPKKSCPVGSRPLNWSQTGPQGPVGPPATCTGIPHVGIDLSNCDLAGAYLPSANFSGANLSGADLTDANLNSTNLTGANMAGADLTDVTLSGANTSGDNMTGANLDGDSDVGANFSGANLTGANMNLNSLVNANLDGATMTGAIVTGVQWKNTICPDGTNRNSDGGACVNNGA